MNILPINIQSSNSKCGNSHQTFKARLFVHSSANKVGLQKFKETPRIWDTIIDAFKKKLKDDPIKPYDVVELKAIPSKKSKSVYTGKSEWTKFEYTSYSTEGNSTKTAYYDKPIYESEDLEVSINRSREGFLLNNNRSTWDIIDDLYNTYKRVRYKEHFEK